jgi:integrase
MREEFATTGRLTDRQRLITETIADYLDGRRAAGLSTTSIAREERFGDLVTGYFGRVRTADLTVEDLDRFLLDISLGLPDAEGQPTRPLAGRDHLRRLRASLRRAIRNDQRLGLVSTNVANLAELPADTGTSRSTRALSLGELGRLLDQADGAIGVLVDLIGRHGLRPAEARAMTWANVDLRRGVLRVTAQIGATNTFAPPKTTRATRTIRLHLAAAERLEAWRPRQADERQTARQAWTELDLVATTGMGTPIDRNNLNRSIRRLCGQTDIEPAVTPYELRHTAITHQCEAGHHAWQIADWAGTSEKMIYTYYRHLLHEIASLPPIAT